MQVATVEYDYEGTHYTRESFASYPDQANCDKSEVGRRILDFSAQLHTWLKGGQQFEKISDNEIKIIARPANLSESNGLGNMSKIVGEARMYIDAGNGAKLSVSDDCSP